MANDWPLTCIGVQLLERGEMGGARQQVSSMGGRCGYEEGLRHSWSEILCLTKARSEGGDYHDADDDKECQAVGALVAYFDFIKVL